MESEAGIPDVPLGALAAADDEGGEDTLVAMLDHARRQGGRGSLRARRRIWRYCEQAFRDWHGLHLLADAPIVRERALSKVEMVELLRVAEQCPTVIRDLLRLHRQAAQSRQRVSLRELRWSADRRHRLIELHQLALFTAGVELERARQSRAAGARDLRRGNYRESCAQREKMVTYYTRQIAVLEEQLSALRVAVDPPS